MKRNRRNETLIFRNLHQPPDRNKHFRSIINFLLPKSSREKKENVSKRPFESSSQIQPERRLSSFWINDEFIRTGILFKSIKMWAPFPQKKGFLAWIGVGNLSFILTQSPWPPQETPSIGWRNGLLSSWPELLATRPEWKYLCLFESIIIHPASGSRLRNK